MTLKDFISASPESRADLAMRIGCSVQGLNKWIYGHRIPRPETMQRIHEITGGKVGPSDFIPVADKPGVAA